MLSPDMEYPTILVLNGVDKLRSLTTVELVCIEFLFLESSFLSDEG